MRFSIIVVCLNAGESLRETVESIRRQSEQDYEIIIKDGVSTDAVTASYLEQLERESADDSRIRVFRHEKDCGIYDAMNQAVQYIRGEYVLFLNCGDCFYDGQVLAKVRERIECDNESRLFYGNIQERLTGALVQSNPVIDDFACYRNLPCHQACFYGAELLKRRGFDTAYRVRADYEHFLWCYFRADARPRYIPVTLASYEGGGFSETPENRKRSAREHREITALYMGRGQRLRYRLILLATLAPLRTRMAESPAWSGLYNKCKKLLYRKTA